MYMSSIITLKQPLYIIHFKTIENFSSFLIKIKNYANGIIPSDSLRKYVIPQILCQKRKTEGSCTRICSYWSYISLRSLEMV